MIRPLRIFVMALMAASLLASAGHAALAAPAEATPPPPELVGPEGVILPPPPALPDPFLHTANAGNIFEFITTINNTQSNGRGGYVPFVTHNWTRPDGIGPQHRRGLGMAYLNNRWTIMNQDQVTDMPDPISFNVMVAPPSTYAYTHTTSALNIVSNSSALDQPLANGNPNALVFITPRLTGANVTITRTLGVWFKGTTERWQVFTEDQTPMPQNQSFSVYVTSAGSRAFVHTATEDNIINNHTLIDHPLANNNRHANILITQNWNPGGGVGVYNNQYVGVFYVNSLGRWAIFNENTAVDMPEGASFNVLIGRAKVFLPLLTR